jgi:DNA excision repair protein ERCC-4
MGANEEEENYFTKRLEADDVKLLPKKVTTEYSIPDRQKLYLEGGVLFITTRIMVVDMLTDRMPMCKTGYTQ